MFISSTVVAQAVAILSIVSIVQAAAHTVNVGGLTSGNALSFDPSNISISPGDTVSFMFNAVHTASHASLTDPCSPASPSDFNFNGSPGAVFNQTFNTAGTFNFFCMLPGHCQAGMKGVILVGQGAAQSGSTAAASSSPTTSQSSGSSGGGLYGSASEASTVLGTAKLALLSAAVVIATVTI
jgi:plastocyanin